MFPQRFFHWMIKAMFSYLRIQLMVCANVCSLPRFDTVEPG
jgi:hypothetical protein